MKKNAKIFCVFFAVLLLIMSFPFSCFASDTNPMKDTSVLNDLTSFGYDVTRYGKDEGAENVAIIDFLEYGYSADGKQGLYGLYVYVYNPTGREIFANGNSLEMSVSLKDGSYSNYMKCSLELLDVSTRTGYENVLYKFYVKESALIAQRIHSDLRTYRISGIELKYDESVGAKPIDYAVGREYSYMGFQENFGKTGINTKSTLYKTWKIIDVAEVKLNAASWYSATSDLGTDFRYEVSSVYFNVPNYIVDTYGDLDAECSGLVEVRGSYIKKVTNGLLVPDNSWVGKYDKFAGVDISKNPNGYVYENNTLGHDTFGFYHDMSNIMGTNVSQYGLSYNVRTGGLYPHSVQVVNTVGTFVPSSSTDRFYSGSANYLNYFNAQGRNAWTDINYMSADYRAVVGNTGYKEYVITNDTGSLNSSIKSFASTSSSKSFKWLYKLFNKELYADENGYDDCLPIVEVKGTDFYGTPEGIANNLFVTVDDSNSLKTFYDANKKDNHIYLMRLEVNPYRALDVTLTDKTNAKNDISSGILGDGVYFEKCVFEDIDILEFVFEDKGGSRQVVPVSATPIDNVGSIVTPPGSSLDGGNDNPNDNNLTDIRELMSNILLIVMIIAGLVLLTYVIYWVVTGVGAVVKPISSAVGKGINFVAKYYDETKDFYHGAKRRVNNYNEGRKRRREQRETDKANRETFRNAEKEARKQQKRLPKPKRNKSSGDK